MACIRRAVAVSALAATVAVGAGEPARKSVQPDDLAYVYGVGQFVPEYAPPPPGSYDLPAVDAVSDHPLLGSDGRRTGLYEMTRGRVAVVAFVYTTCAEAAGCPVSTGVLHRLDGLIAGDPALRGRVRLVTLSFDPARDTPARLATVRGLHAPKTDWAFATAPDEASLEPLLADFGQPVARLRYDDGTWTGLYRHVLKVFLVDTRHRVRNVYSTGFLHPELIMNDVRTVLLDDAPEPDDAKVRTHADKKTPGREREWRRGGSNTGPRDYESGEGGDAVADETTTAAKTRGTSR